MSQLKTNYMSMHIMSGLSVTSNMQHKDTVQVAVFDPHEVNTAM